jgi:hydroxymethylpyrimidine pyrophosphatase-like HAD family hydrolase
VTDDWGPPRLIALDIDGTILQVGRPVSERVLSAVRKAMAVGAHVVLATGRSVFSTKPVLTELGLVAGEIVCSNGAVRMDLASGEFRAVHHFDAGPLVDRLVELLPGAQFAVERLGTGNLVYGGLGSVVEPEWVAHVDLVALVAEPTTRLTLFWEGHTAEELSLALTGAGFTGITYTLDRVDPWLVAVAEGITKAAALEQLRTELDIPIDATLAVGDGDNDIEMLRWAGRGVAMGQAPDIVKAAAREVTGTFDEDGLATVLERWF